MDPALLIPTASAPSPLLTDLLAHYPMVDGGWAGSETTEDVVGGYNATADGAISLESSDLPAGLSGAAYFDGLGEKFTITSLESELDILVPVDSAWTIALFVKMGTGDSQTLFSCYDGGGVRRFRLTRANSDSLDFFVDFSTGGLETPNPKNLDLDTIWHFIVAKYVPGTGNSCGHLEIGGGDNDTEFTSDDWAHNANTSNMRGDVADLTIGDEATGNRPFNGRMCNLSIWGTELSDELINTYYAGGAGIPYPF